MGEPERSIRMSSRRKRENRGLVITSKATKPEEMGGDSFVGRREWRIVTRSKRGTAEGIQELDQSKRGMKKKKKIRGGIPTNVKVHFN